MGKKGERMSGKENKKPPEATGGTERANTADGCINDVKSISDKDGTVKDCSACPVRMAAKGDYKNYEKMAIEYILPIRRIELFTNAMLSELAEITGDIESLQIAIAEKDAECEKLRKLLNNRGITVPEDE